MIRTKDWFIPTNDNYLGSAASAKSPGSWQSIRGIPDFPEYVVFQLGADRPWGGLQLRVDPASGAVLLVREWAIDSDSGSVIGYRDFHTSAGMPGIQYFPPTLPGDGSAVEWSQRYIIDMYNWQVDDQGTRKTEPIWFESKSKARYLGMRPDDLTGVYAIGRSDDWDGSPGYDEEYLFGRLPDGSTVGLYGWIAPVFNREQINTLVVEFKTPNAFKLLVPWQGIWQDVWLWTKAGMTWVPGPPAPATLRVPQGSPKPPYPAPSPNPEPEPVPEPPAAPGGGSGDPVAKVEIDVAEVERILKEEVQTLLDNLRAALRAL